MEKHQKTIGFKKHFFVSFLFLTLASITVSCSTTTVEEELGTEEINEKPETYLIDKSKVTPPGDRGQ